MEENRDIDLKSLPGSFYTEDLPQESRIAVGGEGRGEKIRDLGTRKYIGKRDCVGKRERGMGKEDLLYSAVTLLILILIIVNFESVTYILASILYRFIKIILVLFFFLIFSIKWVINKIFRIFSPRR